MRRPHRRFVVAVAVVAVTGCGVQPAQVGGPAVTPSTVAAATASASRTPTPTAAPTTPSKTASTTTPKPTAKPQKPKRCTVTSRTWKGHRRFFTTDTTCYSSPWFAGTHRIMIGFGCNTSPWYPKVARCHWKGGVHHGIDIDMPVGTAVRSAVSGTAVVRPSTMGSAYGRNGLIIRSRGRDYVLGHLSRLKVRTGQHVRPGQLIARSGMSGVENEDGPHLHFEVRPAGGGYRTAVNPRSFLRLAKAR